MRSPAAKVRFAAFLLLTLGLSRAPAQTLQDLFDDTKVQEIRLTIKPSDWQTLTTNYLTNSYYPAIFTWRYQGKDIGLDSEVGIRSRGTGSRSPIKPSLRIDFNRFDDTQEFLNVKSIILRNNSQDASQGMHERLSMMLYKRTGFPTSREAYARLYINGSYFGLFTVVESVDKKWLMYNFGEDEGYLYEFKYKDPGYHFEYLGSNPNLYSGDGLMWQPETHDNNPDPKPLEAMVRAINQSSDTDFVSAVSQFLDLKLFMAQMAIDNFVADNDSVLGDWGMNNFWFYRFVGKNLSQFIPWDKSETLVAMDFSIFKNHDTNVLMKRAMKVPELRNAYLAALAKCAALVGGQGGWMDGEAAYQLNQVRPNTQDDPHRLCKGPDGMPAPCTMQQFEDGVKTVQQFVRGRGEWVKGKLADAGYELRAVNAASFVAGELSPGSLISIFAAGLGTSTAQAQSFPLLTQMAGVNVKINGIDAPLLYVSPYQVNLQVPLEAAPGPATITATGTATTTISTTISAASPGIFVVVHADYSPVTTDNPAKANEVLLVFANGLGAVNGSVQTGQPAPAVTTKEKPVITIGSLPATVQYSGLAAGFAGLYQINVQVPSGLLPNDRTLLTLKTGGVLSAPTQIPIR